MRYLLLIFSILVHVQLVHAQIYMGESIDAKFISEAPLNTFEGNSGYLAGMVDFDKNLVDFYLDINTLKTGISLRDKHMRENYLETEKYRYAEFTGRIINKEKLDLTLFGKEQLVLVKGKFKVHGESQEMTISGTVNIKNSGDLLLLTAAFDIKLSDFKIEKPSLVGYELADIQKVRISGELHKDE